MAERRMFAKSIIDSDAFLDMPVTARLLYYDLGMRADDDGFVNSYKKIMRMIGASTDDMNILIAKKFVIPFESGVVVIKHWRINNYIRKDRYNETNYKDEKSMLTVDDIGNYHLINDNGIPSGIPAVDTGKVSIGKDNIDISSKNSIDYQKIIELYHKNCPSLPKVTKITDARKKLINARLKDYSEKELEKAFMAAEESDFLTGRNGKWGGANFDWVMNTNNIVKILEGNYKNKTETKTGDYRNTMKGNYDFEALEREAREGH